jgi:predicted nuclease of predicted toxin-antitoxin system
MAAPDRTSKKQSAASFGSTPPKPALVFFVDRSLGQKVIAEKLRQNGVDVEIHDDHFPQNALDEDWLSEVGQRGWVVLTKDDRIRYRPAELAAYRQNKVRVFVLGSGEMKAQEMADAFVKAPPKIFRFTRKNSAPFFARISRNGRVSLL